MKLTSITFTGIDERTDLDRVREISEKYPYVEWGVLLSYHWKENGNRYPNPALLAKLEYGGLRLSAHLCGRMAMDVADGETRQMYETLNWNFDIFRRCQLNINVSARYKELRSMRPFDRRLDEVILQMNNGDSLDSFLKYTEIPLFHVAYLLDASGGRGIDSPIHVFDNKDIHIGYAGGMNPENVGVRLQQLLDFYSHGKFWIDMESGVRTEDDWFDLDKVQQVLDVCDPIITEHERAIAEVSKENRRKELSLSLQIQSYLNTASDELYGKGKPLYSEKRLKDIHECMKMWAKLHNSYFYNI